MKTTFANWEIATYVVHLLGGTTRTVGTEDIAKRCFELAPDCFSWVNYPEYPDKDVVRSALVDARKPKYGGMLQGRAGRGRGQVRRTSSSPAPDGWRLTEAGAKWVVENEQRLAEHVSSRESISLRQDRRQKLARIREHRIFRRFLEQPEGFSPSLGEMAELLRCRVDADQGTWDKRFQQVTVLAEADRDKVVLTFLDKCRNSLQSQM